MTWNIHGNPAGDRGFGTGGGGAEGVGIGA